MDEYHIILPFTHTTSLCSSSSKFAIVRTSNKRVIFNIMSRSQIWSKLQSWSNCLWFCIAQNLLLFLLMKARHKEIHSAPRRRWHWHREKTTSWGADLTKKTDLGCPEEMQPCSHLCVSISWPWQKLCHLETCDKHFKNKAAGESLSACIPFSCPRWKAACPQTRRSLTRNQHRIQTYSWQNKLRLYLSNLQNPSVLIHLLLYLQTRLWCSWCHIRAPCRQCHLPNSSSSMAAHALQNAWTMTRFTINTLLYTSHHTSISSAVNSRPNAANGHASKHS